MRLIDADAYLDRMKKDPLFDLIEGYGFSGTLLAEPAIAAIPIDFIESEKRFVSDLSFQAYEAGNIERAKGLSNVALNLDALISNWEFIRGDEWRENRKKAMIDD